MMVEIDQICSSLSRIADHIINNRQQMHGYTWLPCHVFHGGCVSR